MTELDSKGSFRKFEDAVIDGAERKAAAIVVEAEQYRQSELRAASQGSGAAELERKRQELLTARSQYAAKRRQGSRRQLLETRRAMAQSLFDEVEGRIAAFTATAGYDAWLTGRAQRHAALAGQGVTVLLRPADESKQGLLRAVFPQASFETDRAIRCGGFKLVVGRVLYDETLDAAFAAEQERFTAESGLRV